MGASGEHGALAGSTSFFDDIGVRYHTKEGKLWWPTRSIARLGFVMDTNRGEVKVAENNVAKALGLRRELPSSPSGSSESARALLVPVSYLNFLLWGGAGRF